MATRPSWRGHLKLSLVTCPVALYTAVNPAGDVHFHLINPKTNNRVRMVTTDPDTGPVDRKDLVKGFEIEKDQYVFVTPEELESVKLESTKIIDIERFLPADEIDRTYWDHPYFLAPDGDLAQEAFAVIRDAMAGAGRIALGRAVISTRERLIAVEPSGKGMMAWTLRSKDEVKNANAVFGDIKATKPDKEMVEVAERIIEQKEAPFDPSKFTDRYEDALKALIEAKRKGHKVEEVEQPEDTNVIDLMAALRASLGKKARSHSSAKGSKGRKASTKGKTSGSAKRRKAS
ncbi:Ku protein [Methylobacterium gnaphalii]|uniref:Non-homologous end joining protein Ku n=1 Tax=Methylobacterium gnaphalii TaxID=1010610 RepID=A0A512JQS3_9HYPH|nr:Ku protein [Methylobacterium gnaphalii]GEP12308.1 non-homologous end joining protein Ku [Methylobacterium gnaphalii]GJD70910.1 Non-homologous end joining protein Ku [Methylobacterium gnaphalii]GLS50909.1 non-homologous end joining protein Ku [Methylobacterium gnaphalii]